MDSLLFSDMKSKHVPENFLLDLSKSVEMNLFEKKWRY